MGLFKWLFNPKTISPPKNPVTTTINFSTASRLPKGPKKRFIHSIGLNDGTIKVTWRDQKEAEYYSMTPFRHNSFIDSGEFYLIGQFLQREPEGFQVSLNKEIFKICKISS
ncbi:MAG: hypothetical protein DWQ19_10545 [Crenarchaeota archaeon]|nr:MAG: hypothetical protein DWQ19_10545 [Thermoproteota archaeon]